MRLPSILARVAGRLITRGDGDPKPGPWYLPITGGWLPEEVGSYWNWWQMGGLPIPQSAQSAIVEACISAYSQTIAMCPGDHWRASAKGGRERVPNSALTRVLRQPNAYQTISDFLLNMVRLMYLEGNAYALAIRNNRFEIAELHIMNPMMSWPQVASTGDVFYQLGGNQVVDRYIGGNLIVPARDVLHLRLHVSRSAWPYPLIGETPLTSVANDIQAQAAIIAQQTSFYRNQARPSAVLSTDLVLDKDQVQALRDRWNEQSKGMFQGGTPILTAGLKVQPWGAVPSKDSGLAELIKFSDEHIAMAYRIPLQILGAGGSQVTNTEALMQFWISSGLGFALNHIEEAIGVLFGLKGQPDEYCEFSTEALLRSAMAQRIEALARGVQGGIYSPNEAREKEGLDSVKYGDEPRVQQQVVPLSAAAAIPATPGPPSPFASPSAPTAALPKPKPSDDGPPSDKTPSKSTPGNREDAHRREVRRIFAAASRHGRRRSS